MKSPDAGVAGDGVLLAVLARNLIENAIRHGPERSLVSVKLARQDTHTELAVTDAGAGKSGNSRLFEGFHLLQHPRCAAPWCSGRACASLWCATSRSRQAVLAGEQRNIHCEARWHEY